MDLTNKNPLYFNMSEKLIPLLGEEKKETPPTYDAVAAQHGALPTRNGPPPSGAKPLPRGPFPLDIPVLNQLKGKRIILASASPRRKQLLATVCITLSMVRQSLIIADWPYKPRNPPLHQTRESLQSRARPLRICPPNRRSEMSRRLYSRLIKLSSINTRPLSRYFGRYSHCYNLRPYPREATE